MQQVVQIEKQYEMMSSALERATQLSAQQQQEVDDLMACCADENAIKLRHSLKSPPK